MRSSSRATLVTGAAGGIEAAIVTTLRAEGARGAAPSRNVQDIAAEAHPPGVADVTLVHAQDHARHLCGALVEVNGGKSVS